MNTFKTKMFHTADRDITTQIDTWLNSFNQPNRPRGEYDFEIARYIYTRDRVLITVRVFDAELKTITT